MVLQLSYALNNGVGLYSSEWPNGYTGALPQYSPYTAVDPGIGDFQLTDNHAHSRPHDPDLVQPAALSTAGGPQFFSDAVLSDGQSLAQQVFVTPGCPPPSVSPCTVQSRPGTLGRNTFRTDSFSNVDFSLVKDTRITEAATLEVRSEFFNLFNQHAFGTPGQVLGTGSFGIASSTSLAERQIQFGLRLIF